MHIIEKNGQKVAVIDHTKSIQSAQDALDMMAAAQYLGCNDAIVLFQESLNEDFFDLKTRFAGEVLQKFSNYNVRLAIVGDFSQYKSKALHDFIYECNNGKLVVWVSNLETALNALTSISYFTMERRKE